MTTGVGSSEEADVNTSRRGFLMSIGALVASMGCALKVGRSSTKGPGTISGNVWDRRQLKSMAVSRHPVFLRQFRRPDGTPFPREGEWYGDTKNNRNLNLEVVAKTYTSRQGYFEFKHLAPGHYYVQPLRGDVKFVMIHPTPERQLYYAGFFIYRS